MKDLTIVSADSHLIEPPNLWVEHIEKKYQNQAPHTVRDYLGKPGEWFVGGTNEFPVSDMFAQAVKGSDLPEFFKCTFDDAPASVWDPGERLKEQDTDGVKGEVVYTSYGLALFGLKDSGLTRACFKVYNDYAAEYCSHDPDRLVGIGMIDLADIPAAVADLKDCADKGLRGVMIASAPSKDRPYSSSEYDPFWAAAQDLNMVITLHIHSAYDGMGVDMNRVVTTMVTLNVEIMQSLSDMIIYGVFERFPKLRVVSAENDCAWLPSLMWRLDHYYKEWQYREGEYMKDDDSGQAIAKLSMPPSEYLKRNVMVTFQHESADWVDSTRRFIGNEGLAWGSDYPHSDGTFTNSQDIIAGLSAKMPKTHIQKMVGGNISNLYGINVN